MRVFIGWQKEQRWCAESDEDAFGSVSEIQSGWFMLGLNVWFALDATTATNQLHIDCLSSLATNEVRTTSGCPTALR